jgi:hypothetical protein
VIEKPIGATRADHPVTLAQAGTHASLNAHDVEAGSERQSICNKRLTPMNAHTPPNNNPAATRLANDIMGRLNPLDLTITNARGFRALLEDLHGRDLSAIQEPHISAIHLVRAAALRSAISTIMATVDNRGTDRASVGQIIHMFETMDLSVLAYRWADPTFGSRELQAARDDWTSLQATPEFQDCRDFRDGAIGHTLVLALPTVRNEAYFRVQDAAERITRRFYRICGYGKPSFPGHQAALAASAKTFWDMYFKGMAAP